MEHKTHLTMDQVAQGLHVALGALFLMIPVAKGWHHPRVHGFLFGVLYAAVKEFWWDIHYEDHATSGGWRGGVKDFSFYLVGMAAAFVVLL